MLRGAGNARATFEHALALSQPPADADPGNDSYARTVAWLKAALARVAAQP